MYMGEFCVSLSDQPPFASRCLDADAGQPQKLGAKVLPLDGNMVIPWVGAGLAFLIVVGVASIVTCTLWMFFEKFEYIADMLY